MSKSMANNSFDTSISAFRAGGPWYRPKARAKVMASWSTSSTPASCSDSKSTARFWWRFSLVIWVAKNVTNQIQHRTVLPLWCLNGVTQYQAAWYGLPCEWTNFKFSYLWKWFWMCFLTLNFWSFFAIFFLARPHPPPPPRHTPQNNDFPNLYNFTQSFAKLCKLRHSIISVRFSRVPRTGPIFFTNIDSSCQDPWGDPTARPRHPPGFGAAKSPRRETVSGWSPFVGRLHHQPKSTEMGCC